MKGRSPVLEFGYDFTTFAGSRAEAGIWKKRKTTGACIGDVDLCSLVTK